MVADVVDALCGQRMGAQIRILTDPGKHLLPLKNLEELEEPARRLAAGIQKGHGRVIGGGLLRYRILHEGAFGDALGAEQGSAAPTAPAGDRGGGGEHHRNNSFDTGVPRRLLKARQVPPGYMPGLMREHPDQLVRRFGAHDQSLLFRADDAIRAFAL